MNYFIDENYVSRLDNSHHDDRTFKAEYQNEVYATAKFYLNLIPGNDVLDIGCGSGFKLMKWFKACKTTGLELEPCLSYLKSTYPNRNWLHSSFDLKLPAFDIVICSDVIEHLADPNQLLDFINGLDFKFCVMSTPNRDELISKNLSPVLGPPLNKAHVREWNLEEFQNYLSSYFDIVEHKECKAECSQIVVVTKKAPPIA